jgi:CTP synthase (UTP-ammonia lyase)
VLRIDDAQHAEYAPAAATALIAPVSCPVPDRAEGAPRLSGKLPVRLTPGSLAQRACGGRAAEVIQQEFSCNFELNPVFEEALQAAGLRITGRGEHGEARIVELPANRFFLATLFLPQLSSIAADPDPLIVAYLSAATSEGAAQRATLQAAP